ncbi:hypothetical protein ACFO4P_10790 [Epilithonimonas pallida]|uniref:Uncharacterized protein n=1 Tax=Epilithonimonas pallida TaxID=373671 RepID=A0ABY1R1P1_9FLAO|nr:hypothetical protein [Epilithonimonas pallida]SMP92469.1 hypothetical protein SAMN05421679_10466 [Epilithonimonas pallida]
MDAQLKKIDALVRKYLHRSKIALMVLYGVPNTTWDDDIWIYKQTKNYIFKTEIVFIFKNNRVKDIIIFEYILGILWSEVFYNANHSPRYEVVNHYQRFRNI